MRDRHRLGETLLGTLSGAAVPEHQGVERHRAAARAWQRSDGRRHAVHNDHDWTTQGRHAVTGASADGR
jgi:hypothetical protein